MRIINAINAECLSRNPNWWCLLKIWYLLINLSNLLCMQIQILMKCTDAGNATWIIMVMQMFEACVHHKLDWVPSPPTCGFSWLWMVIFIMGECQVQLGMVGIYMSVVYLSLWLRSFDPVASCGVVVILRQGWFLHRRVLETEWPSNPRDPKCDEGGRSWLGTSWANQMQAS